MCNHQELLHQHCVMRIYSSETMAMGLNSISWFNIILYALYSKNCMNFLNNQIKSLLFFGSGSIICFFLRMSKLKYNTL
uniref:G-protein coupled receptors family 1 profile domain-containing protein n=1 Tax=Strongyloides venezuelensis TaxID=75913 RepID=A0A0K0FR97_STRVS